MPAAILYDYFRSSASYRVRIALNLKGLAYDRVAIDLRTGEQQHNSNLSRNPLGFGPSYHTGEILFDNRDVLKMSAEELRRFRWNEASMVFQSAMNQRPQ